MKTTIKFFLVITLFGSITLADDGNMGTSNRNCTQQQSCLVADQNDENANEENGILEYVQEFLAKILG
ncbi:MAG TPA: hypothetical protein PKE69_09225 [Pyrinomonadaceae bacterium]|nr:hypothetical protein [Pyrinomonadaceae bacterium]